MLNTLFKISDLYVILGLALPSTLSTSTLNIFWVSLPSLILSLCLTNSFCFLFFFCYQHSDLLWHLLIKPSLITSHTTLPLFQFPKPSIAKTQSQYNIDGAIVPSRQLVNNYLIHLIVISLQFLGFHQ